MYKKINTICLIICCIVLISGCNSIQANNKIENYSNTSSSFNASKRTSHALTTSIIKATTKTTKRSIKSTQIKAFVDDWCIKKFNTVDKYQVEFKQYTSFDDIIKLMNLSKDSIEKQGITADNASIMLKNNYFFIFSLKNNNPDVIYYNLSASSVAFNYSGLKIGYLTSVKDSKYFKELFKTKDSFVSFDKYKVFKTKKTQYSWYDNEYSCVFFIEFNSNNIRNTDEIKQIINNLDVKMIKI